LPHPGESPCSYAISHQFADKKYIKEALKEKGKRINLIQQHHAEDNIGVAAASILARAVQMKALEGLSAKYPIALPRGASWEAAAGRGNSSRPMGSFRYLLPKVLRPTHRAHRKGRFSKF